MTPKPKRGRGQPRKPKSPKIKLRPKAITPGKTAGRISLRLDDDLRNSLDSWAVTHGKPSVSDAVRDILKLFLGG